MQIIGLKGSEIHPLYWYSWLKKKQRKTNCVEEERKIKDKEWAAKTE